MNNGIPSVKLNDICRPTQWPTIPQSAMTDDGYPVYGANGRIGFYSEYNHEEPTVLITCRGATCGTINVCEPRSYVTGNAMALDELDMNRADLRFVAYALNKRGLRDAITGSAQPQITRTSLSGVEIPLPPLSEQKRIADILDKADTIRRKRQEAIGITRDICDAEIATTLRSNECRPSTFSNAALQIIDGDRGAQYPKSTDFLDEGHCLFLSAKNVTKSGFDFSDRQFITVERDNALRNGKLKRYDVVLTTRGTVGNVAYYGDDVPYEDVRINSGMLILRVDPCRLSAGFLALYLGSSLFQRQVQRLRSGSAQPQLPVRTLEHMTLHLPQLREQLDCVRKIDAVNRTGRTLAQARDEACELFNSLVQGAFKGEL
jgi:type I restriction enzyme S subunit